MHKVYYFNLYGRAEPIRMLLAHAKIQFEDKRFEFADWPTVKGHFEFGQVPALEITDAEGKVHQYTQTLSILRYLSIKHGYYPADPEKAFECDSALDSVNDTINGLVKIVWEQDPAKKAEYAKAFFTGPYPIFLKAMSNRLSSNGTKFLTGDTLCTADFHFGSLILS